MVNRSCLACVISSEQCEYIIQEDDAFGSVEGDRYLKVVNTFKKRSPIPEIAFGGSRWADVPFVSFHHGERGEGHRGREVMVQPISFIFRYLQNRSQIQVWCYEQLNMQLEGCVIAFDEYMSLVSDDTEEIHSKIK